MADKKPTTATAENTKQFDPFNLWIYDEVFALIPARLFQTQAFDMCNIQRFHIDVMTAYAAKLLRNVEAGLPKDRVYTEHDVRQARIDVELFLTIAASIRKQIETVADDDMKRERELWDFLLLAFRHMHGPWFEWFDNFSADFDEWRGGAA